MSGKGRCETSSGKKNVFKKKKFKEELEEKIFLTIKGFVLQYSEYSKEVMSLFRFFFSNFRTRLIFLSKFTVKSDFFFRFFSKFRLQS